MSERILVVNPNSTASCTAGIAEALAGFAAPGLPRLEVVQLEGGPPAVVTWRDWFSVAEPLCRLAEREPAAAFHRASPRIRFTSPTRSCTEKGLVM